MLSQDVRSALRLATAPCHDRVDRLYSRFDLRDRDGYGRFLMAQATAHLGVEDALEQADAAAVLPDWPQRRRSALLRADLAAMDRPVPEAVSSVSFAGSDAVLGGIYVLEGSRLGGRLLRRSVPPGFACRFLDAADPGGWRGLLAMLERALGREDQRQRAIEAAIAVFGAFEAAAERHLNA